MAKDRQKTARDRQSRDNPEPRSLPPETGVIDANWDDDVQIMDSDPTALSARVTKVPTTPPDVARLMAAAEASEARASGQAQEGSLGAARVPLLEGSLPELPTEPPPPPRAAEHRSLSESGLPLHGSRRPDEQGDHDDSLHRKRTRPEAPRSLLPRIGSIDELTLELPEIEPEFELDPARASSEAAPEIELGQDSGVELACMYADMKDRYAIGDFTGALVIAESILEVDTADPEATRYAESCRSVLTQMYAARLGSLAQVVSVAIPIDQIRWLSLDHRAGFLLSLVDGISTVEELLDISGMTRLEALRIMYTLLEQRVISVEAR